MMRIGAASSSQASSKVKPVIVRIKRKASQEPLDAFWLEINERPHKKALVDYFSGITLEETANKILDDLRPKKVLVQHVETISDSQTTKDALLPFLDGTPDSNCSLELKSKNKGRRSMFKQNKKQDQMHIARQKHEDAANSARYEQIWRHRREGKETVDECLKEICHLYDVVRVDEEKIPTRKLPEPKNIHREDNAILCNYLPLLRKFLPVAAEDVESELNSCRSAEEHYVYDLYTVNHDDLDKMEDGSFTEYPLVQVDDDTDNYSGQEESEYDSDDSNAENNPLYDYPDELSQGEEDDDRDPLDSSNEETEYEREVRDSSDENDADDGWRYEYRP